MRHLYGTLLGVILLVGCSAQPTTPNYPSGKTWMAGEEPSRDRNPASASIEGAIDARMLRYPDISDRHIVFVYAGDIWIAPRAGGDARRLTTAKGEEAFPRFSPDGNEIAFTGNYDGNEDAYIMPITGGIPRRLTYHPAEDRVNDWTPDGRSVLIASARDGGIEKGTQLYSISTQGGLAEKLPVPYGAFGTIAPGGSILAYVPITNDFRTWKRYRGGNTSDIWIFNLEKLTSRVLVRENANSSQPMWHGDSLYFVSDRDDNKRNNIWRCDVASGSFTQVTKFETMDVRFPAIGGDSIVFECGGKLNILDLKTSKYEEVSIRVLTDHITLKPRIENVSKLAGDVDVSPSAKRFVVAARGDIFSMPKEHGVTLNLTQTSGIAERTPAISPDGKTVAYFTDRTGEYELALRPLEGRGEERILTKLGPGFRYYPQWSPDSKKIVFIDQMMQVFVHDIEGGATTKVDQCLSKYEGELRGFEVSWSADSRWFAYATEATNTYEAIFIYDTAENKLRQVTSAYYNDSSPAFDPDGKYLYYISKREFGRPLYSDIDHTWVYTNMRRIIAVPLRDDVPSPIAPRNDSELDKKKSEGDGESEGDGADEKESRMREASTNSDLQRRERPRRPDAAEETEGKAEEEEDTPVKRKPPKPVEIAFDDFERRGVVLPPEVNNYSALKAVSGKVLYIKQSTAGYSDDDEESKARSAIVYYDLKAREEKTVFEGARGFDIAADGKHILVFNRKNHVLIKLQPNAKAEHILDFKNLEAMVDPRAEWRQIFNDAWRIERDYFYDPGLHGVDWPEMKRRYEPLLDACVTRWDVNYVLGEMLSELNAGHVYRGGGDFEEEPRRATGMLGCDFAIVNGHVQIKRIVETAPWDAGTRSPLSEQGANVKAGDYLLAVNGISLDVTKEPWAAFAGLAGETVMLTVNSQPSFDGARDVLVTTLASEGRLRYLEGVERNRKKVELASGGRIGYVHVPDTGTGGQGQLVRQFQSQTYKDAVVVDERFNSGGQIPDRFIEYLKRPTINYWGTRTGRIWKTPYSGAGDIPMAMLINGPSGSGGDAFPLYFRMEKLGPLIGTTTWGGLIGITGNPDLVDGGFVTAPTFGIFDTEGKWIVENEGVAPDIEVLDDPAKRLNGGDPQLEKAIEHLLAELEKNPPKRPAKPEYPDRSGR